VCPSLTTLTIVRYCAINWPPDIVMSADASLHAPIPEKHTTALTARTHAVSHSQHAQIAVSRSHCIAFHAEHTGFKPLAHVFPTVLKLLF